MIQTALFIDTFNTLSQIPTCTKCMRCVTEIKPMKQHTSHETYTDNDLSYSPWVPGSTDHPGYQGLGLTVQ